MSTAIACELSFCVATNGAVDTLHGDPVISVHQNTCQLLIMKCILYSTKV